MIEFYRHCYICIYIFSALRFITLQRTYIIPNNSIRARSIFPFNPDLSHCVARGNVSRADHLSPPYLERKLNEIARSRYRVKENKKKIKKNKKEPAQGEKVLTKWRARGTRNAKRGHRRGEICNRAGLCLSGVRAIERDRGERKRSVKKR